MFRKLLVNADLCIASAALIVVVASVVWGVVTRYILAQPATWTTELSSIAFAWVVFFGAAAAMRRGMHIAIPIFVEMLPASGRRTAAIAGLALVLIFACYSAYLAGLLALQSFDRPSPVLRIPFSYVYGGIAAALALTALHSVAQLVAVWRSSNGSITYVDQREGV